MMVWKMMFLFNWVILRFHVNLPGCNLSKGIALGNWIESTLKVGHFLHVCFFEKKKGPFVSHGWTLSMGFWHHPSSPENGGERCELRGWEVLKTKLAPQSSFKLKIAVCLWPISTLVFSFWKKMSLEYFPCGFFGPYGISGFAIITWNNPLKDGINPTSPRDNTCQSLGLIFPCNKGLMVDPGYGFPGTRGNNAGAPGSVAPGICVPLSDVQSKRPAKKNASFELFWGHCFSTSSNPWVQQQTAQERITRR